MQPENTYTFLHHKGARKTHLTGTGLPYIMKAKIEYGKGSEFMKKRIISMLAAAMLLLVCAVPVWADTDKDIQFSGYTFGETFLEAAQKNWINTVEFQRKPQTSRVIADPVYANASWLMYGDSPVGYCFFSRLGSVQMVAGHEAGVVLRFYFPTKEAAAACEVQNAVFYGGEYELLDQNKKAAFDDLKQKLTTVYGSPSAEFTDPEEFWGKPVYLRGGYVYGGSGSDLSRRPGKLRRPFLCRLAAERNG